MRFSPAPFRAILLTFLVSALPVVAQPPTKADTIKVCRLNVTGMTCAGCEAAVRNAARTVDGVKDIKASYAKHDAEVTYDATKTTPEAIAKVITVRSGAREEEVVVDGRLMRRFDLASRRRDRKGRLTRTAGLNDWVSAHVYVADP